jgi:hypothetical protein
VQIVNEPEDISDGKEDDDEDDPFVKEHLKRE